MSGNVLNVCYVLLRPNIKASSRRHCTMGLLKLHTDQSHLMTLWAVVHHGMWLAGTQGLVLTISVPVMHAINTPVININVEIAARKCH